MALDNSTLRNSSSEMTPRGSDVSLGTLVFRTIVFRGNGALAVACCRVVPFLAGPHACVIIHIGNVPTTIRNLRDIGLSLGLVLGCCALTF